MFKAPVVHLFRAIVCVLLLCSASGQVALAAPTPEIIIKGGVKSLRENVQHFLPFADEDCDTPRWRLRSLLRDSQTQITRAGQALGYYQLEFESDFEMTEDCWKVIITLTPGEPVRVTEVRIVINGDGAEDKVFQEIRENPGIKVGDRLNHAKYETLKGRFGGFATTRGYFDSNFDLAQVSVNLKENSARIELVYSTGPRYKFGEITINQDILDEDFVRRYLNIAEGENYDTEKLLTLKNLYNASNYFAIATISPDLQTLQDRTVPINIQLDARKRRSYSVGAGVATDTGPRLLLGYEDRYLTRRGHSIGADASIAPVQSKVEATYTIPMARPGHEFLRFSTGYLNEETTEKASKLYKVGSRYTVYHDDSWLQTYELSYEMEDYVIGDEDERRSHLLIPSVQYSRSKSDGNPYPMQGWRMMGKLSGSPETLGSDISFLQFHGQAKYIHPVFGGRLLLRLEVGATQVDEFDQLPLSVRFFAGGDTSVRGYSYESIGTNSGGVLIGGKNLLVSSVEYDYLIKPKWALAVFYDEGDAAEDYNFDFKRGVGLGVRWISPIGPVRIDIACALDDVRCSSSSADGWGLHLTMGPDL